MWYFSRVPVRGYSETGGNGSDDSTDSEEELDSPKKIVQQPASASGEKMDVDPNEGMESPLTHYQTTQF